MRHANAFKKLGINTSHRRALLRNMATSLLKVERINTTYRRAKILQPVVESLIRLGANDTLSARRKAYGYIFDKKVVFKLFTELGPRYRARQGGYTRVVRTNFRHGDAAQLAVIELVRSESEKSAPPAETKVSAKASKPKENKEKKEAKPKASASSKSTASSKEKSKKSSKKSE